MGMDRRIEIAIQRASWRSAPPSKSPSETERNGPPDHLLVLVHGILSSPRDWKYAERELKAGLGDSYLIHASAVNTLFSTLEGIDAAGKRLAQEVEIIVNQTPSLKKISFLGHSLGGLFARYAIAALFSSPTGREPQTVNQSLLEELESRGESEYEDTNEKPKIAGLEPINYISLATPHLGVRGAKQLPFLFGQPFLENMAVPVGSFIAGSTGRQLFLTDGKARDPPLLLQMASDCEEGPFISALRSFKERTLYANVTYDHMVGWRTASIRRENELIQPPRMSLQGYRHVVYVMDCPPVDSCGPYFTKETARAKGAVQISPSSSKKTKAYHERVEEEIIRGLQQTRWCKVDVSFHKALWPFLAHNSIQVREEWCHMDGAGVVRHVIDVLKGTHQKGLKSRL